MHWLALVFPTSRLYVPPGQLVNASAASPCPAEAQKPPMGQASHSTALNVVLNDPAGHGVQVPLPLFGASCPGKHG